MQHRSDEIRSIDSWLRVTARNVARADLRHRGAEDRAVRRWWLDFGARTAAAAAYEWSRPEPSVVAAVPALPERQRECIALRYWADLDISAIAARLGISTGAGAAYLRNPTFEQVGPEVPTTGHNGLPPRAPDDLDFVKVPRLGGR